MSPFESLQFVDLLVSRKECLSFCHSAIYMYFKLAYRSSEQTVVGAVMPRIHLMNTAVMPKEISGLAGLGETSVLRLATLILTAHRPARRTHQGVAYRLVLSPSFSLLLRSRELASRRHVGVEVGIVRRGGVGSIERKKEVLDSGQPHWLGTAERCGLAVGGSRRSHRPGAIWWSARL